MLYTLSFHIKSATCTCLVTQIRLLMPADKTCWLHRHLITLVMFIVFFGKPQLFLTNKLLNQLKSISEHCYQRNKLSHKILSAFIPIISYFLIQQFIFWCQRTVFVFSQCKMILFLFYGCFSAPRVPTHRSLGTTTLAPSAPESPKTGRWNI